MEIGLYTPPAPPKHPSLNPSYIASTLKLIGSSFICLHTHIFMFILSYKSRKA